MIYKGNRCATLYRGDHKPAALYRGANRIAGWTDKTKTAPAGWANTYNDFFRVTALGCGRQDGTPTPEAPVEPVASSGTLRACGRNLFVPSKKPDYSSCTDVVISSDWLTAEALGNASATKPGQYVASSGWISFAFPPLTAGAAYTVSLDIEVLDGSNADFVGPRKILYSQRNGGGGAIHEIAENTSQHVVFSFTPPAKYGAFTGLTVSANSQRIRVSNVMIQAGVCADAPYEKGIAGSSVELPVLRQIPGTEVRDTAAYIGGGQWQITRAVKVMILNGLEQWGNYISIKNHFQIPVGDNVFGRYINPVASTHYPENHTPDAYSSKKDYAVMSVDGDRIRVKDARFTEAAEFSTWLAEQYSAGTPVEVWYQTTTPTVETLNLGELRTYPRFASLTAGSDYPPEISATAKVSD